MSLQQYEFIDLYKNDFGLIFLLNKFGIHKNSYVNYLLNKRQKYDENKQNIYDTIKYIYNIHNDGRKTFGYRMMKVFLKYYGYDIRFATAHQYMNKDLGLKSTVFKQKQPYCGGEKHKVFDNIVNRQFSSDEKNKVWLTDFTYIKLTNGKMIYNCSILDLHDRFIVGYASSDKIDANLAVNALDNALRDEKVKGNLILHSDQGSQFASKYFTEFCKSNNITQSMSRAGTPTDNTPMERFFNTLKQEFVYKEKFDSLSDFERDFKGYVNVLYNNQRPHSYNGYKSPFEKRYNITTIKRLEIS